MPDQLHIGFSTPKSSEAIRKDHDTGRCSITRHDRLDVVAVFGGGASFLALENPVEIGDVVEP